MKRRFGLARAIVPMSQQELETLPTRALLARIKRLRWCEESHHCSDLSQGEVMVASHLILFKESSTWRTAYADVKSALVDREHVEKKR